MKLRSMPLPLVLLKRYGVVFRKVLEREPDLPPWRELLYAYRRMEARGEIRGGHFVEGFEGEQFARSEAIALLRKQKNEWQELPSAVISATDPLNLIGTILPGERIPAVHTNRILFKNGLPFAKQLNGVTTCLTEVDPASRWEIDNLLTRQRNPASFRGNNSGGRNGNGGNPVIPGLTRNPVN